ncbi:hypothetical protein B0T17DRAFT_577776 [Bombardia bombarda]|uniref:D-lactate dehydrogenase (cytochrome) n=1 Tax=Bombardia bombarda TaxID=252184 RepID=A0AA39X0T7_9PEZI|nr:hypothetical protein B0T17DRAFT_577776 [Bombardia bombarda]
MLPPRSASSFRVVSGLTRQVNLQHARRHITHGRYYPSSSSSSSIFSSSPTAASRPSFLPPSCRWTTTSSHPPPPQPPPPPPQNQTLTQAQTAHQNKTKWQGRYFQLGLFAITALAFALGHLNASWHPNAFRYARRKKMLAAVDEINHVLQQSRLGTDDENDDTFVTYDPVALDAVGHSEWSTSNSPVRAVAIVYPRTTADVVEIAKICHRDRVPMVPYGAGSSVEGSFAQPFSGLVISFERMDEIVAFHPGDMDVVVQPGVNWVDLNEEIKSSGLFLPMDPSPTATIGGMVGTNCSGTNAYRYGTMRDWVLNVTVVLPDGRVVKTRRRPRKTSAGYDLTGLLVGAEGTLGIVTEVTLRLAPVPEETSVAVVAFPSMWDAAAAAERLIRDGVQLAALEIMDEVQMRMLNEHGSEKVKRRRWEERPTLFLKFAGRREGIRGDVERVAGIVAGFTDGGALVFARSKEEEMDLWAARKEALFTMLSIRPPGTEIWSTDVAVPISRLAEIIDVSKKECGELGIFASVIGHVGDGNFHVAMMYDPQNAEQTQAVSRCVKNMMKRALEMEGTVSGEHAIGIGKKGYLVEELGEETIGLMHALKMTVDNKWIMNPGKVIDLDDRYKIKPWFKEGTRARWE